MTFLISLHFLWVLLVGVNLVIQVAYFYNDRSQKLFVAKKLTTPLLLLFGLFIVLFQLQAFHMIPCLILLVMGIGEIGIEGSSVVESDDEGAENRSSIIVTIAAVLFLLVNVFLGCVLMYRNGNFTLILTGLAISATLFSIVVLIFFRVFKPKKETKFQIILYSFSLVVLFAGTLVDTLAGISTLGLAAALLTVSDSLVLARMGAGFDKKTPSGFKTLLAFLVVILLLYYVYIGVLIHIGSPFPF